MASTTVRPRKGNTLNGNVLWVCCLGFPCLGPEVHRNDSFRHSVTPPVDENLLHMQSRRHRNRGLRLYDFNVPVVPLPRLRDIYWRGVGLGDAMFGLLQGTSILRTSPRQLHLPVLGPRGWDTSTSGSTGALRLMGVRGSPDASADDNNHKKRWPALIQWCWRRRSLSFVVWLRGKLLLELGEVQMSHNGNTLRGRHCDP